MFPPQRGRAKACDGSRACTPVQHTRAHPCPHMHTYRHARSHGHSRRCVLLGASQAIGLQFLPHLSLLQRACSGHFTVWPEQRTVPWGTVKWDTRPVPTVASATPLTGLPCAPPQRVLGLPPAEQAGGALLGRQEAWWWPPGTEDKHPVSLRSPGGLCGLQLPPRSLSSVQG